MASDPGSERTVPSTDNEEHDSTRVESKDTTSGPEKDQRADVTTQEAAEDRFQATDN